MRQVQEVRLGVEEGREGLGEEVGLQVQVVEVEVGRLVQVEAGVGVHRVREVGVVRLVRVEGEAEVH